MKKMQRAGLLAKAQCKYFITFFILLTMVSSSFTAIAYGEETKYIESSGVKLYNSQSREVEGVVEVQGETSNSKIKLLLVRDEEQVWYEVKLNSGRFHEQLWLNKGTGKYTVYVMVNEYDKKYSFGPKFSVNNIKEVNPYLVPDKYIESGDKLMIDKAAELTKSAVGDLEKASAIYSWVKDHVQYDYKKYNEHQNNNYDNEYGALLALESGKGVCFDYAALVAALGRAAGIQTKLVTGTGLLQGSSGYHAWNEMYIAEQQQWIKLDATFASVSGEDFFNTQNFDESHIMQ